MAYSARVIADSINEAGNRLTTMEVVFPRCMLAEFNTHRLFSRNSASSRAIPVRKQIERIMTDPFIPVYWGANKPGMAADVELEGRERLLAISEWLGARDDAVRRAERLLALNLHKQISNRLLEPFMWQTVIVTATEWSNYFALRANAQAQPEIRTIAEMMKEVYAESVPVLLHEGQWHTPLIQPDEKQWAELHVEDAIKVSAGRCARVSYLTHEGVRDLSKDIELCEKLVHSGHMSPLEHVATPGSSYVESKDIDYTEYDTMLIKTHRIPIIDSNFRGWKQFRKTVEHEHDYSLVLAAS